MALQRLPPTRLLSLPPAIRPLLLSPLASSPGPVSHLPTRSLTTTTSSVDPREVTHFNALASSWWDPHGPSRLLHLMNPLRHRFITSCLNSQADVPNLSNLHYLDVGCGGGIFAESAARLQGTASVTGIDPSPEVLAIAKAHMRRDPVLVENGRLRYLGIAIEELAERRGKELQRDVQGGEKGKGSSGKGAAAPVSTANTTQNGYDIVTLFEVLEHVSDPSAFLATLTSHVKPGGWLILSTIARTWTSWFTTKLMAEDVLRIVPRGTHEWAKYVNEDEVRSWFQGEGSRWETPRAMGVMYVPGVGWREVRGGEALGNYFFGVRRRKEG